MANIRKDSPELARFREAVYLVASSERKLATRYKRGPGALSTGRVQALNVLFREKEATAGTLAREAGLSPNSITVMLEQLERSGVVTRRRDESDRRVSWVSLTRKGKAELAALRVQWDDAFASGFADVATEDLETASAVLERLAHVFTAFEVPGSD
jgi:DNA-binding MarR family transcriptional regulator